MDKYKSIGKLSKTFGYDGALKLRMEDRFLELLKSENVVFLKSGSTYVPYFIDKLSLKNPNTIKFENIASKEEAVILCNKEIFLPAEKLEKVSDEKPSKLLFAWAKGYLIIDDEEQVIGEVKEVREFPHQEMAVVDYQEREILLPLHPDLVIGLDEEEQVMMLDIAEGLLDL